MNIGRPEETTVWRYRKTKVKRLTSPGVQLCAPCATQRLPSQYILQLAVVALHPIMTSLPECRIQPFAGASTSGQPITVNHNFTNNSYNRPVKSGRSNYRSLLKDELKNSSDSTCRLSIIQLISLYFSFLLVNFYLLCSTRPVWVTGYLRHCVWWIKMNIIRLLSGLLPIGGFIARCPP